MTENPSRTVYIETGTYTFTVGGDDDVRLYLDDEQVIESWKNQAYTVCEYTKTFDSAGDYQLRLEWYDNCKHAHISFVLSS